MKRALISQTLHEWKENIWLIIELLIVAVIIWGLTLFVVNSYDFSHRPKAFDITGVFAGNIEIRTSPEEGGVDFGEETQATNAADLQALLDDFSRLPMVEAAGLGANALPYQFNYWGSGLTFKEWGDSIQIPVNVRNMTPGMARVLQLKSETGMTPDALADVLKNDSYLYSRSLNYDMQRSDFMTFTRLTPGGYLEGRRIGALIPPFVRNEYELFTDGTLIKPYQENTLDIIELQDFAVRVKPGMEKDFADFIAAHQEFLSRRNVTVHNLHPLTMSREMTTWNARNQQRVYIAGGLLLLFIVFIGLLGTFWSRVHVRTPEIAVRKVFGASNTDIFRRLLSEAMLLLSVSVLLAAAIVVPLLPKLSASLFRSQTYLPGWQWLMVLSTIITLLLMAMMIVVGVAIPAYRAMHIQPALALKEE